MCNQCDDVRRIHGKKPVWLLSVDGGNRMYFSTEDQANRAQAILQRTRPDSVFVIEKVNNYDIGWDF